MKKIKQLLYLLQLEEYQTKRFFCWLKKHDIGKLEERKNKLHWTSRVTLTGLLCLPFLLFLGSERSVGLANKILIPLFNSFENLIVLLAKIKLKLYPQLIKIIITGSYGKTTFKEMLAHALTIKYNVLKTPSNCNTAIGISQMIISELNRQHQILIVEAGAYQKGEIEKICKLIRPSFGVVTSIGWMHLERFKTFDQIRKTKLEIVPFIKDKEKLFLPPKNHQLINYSQTILKICQKLKISLAKAKKQLQNFQPPAHRLTTRKINRHLTILDDTYNANPLGFQQAIKVLKSYQDHQKIIATPGMIELGKKQFELNCQVAEKAAKVADLFVIIGETNKKSLTAGAKKARHAKIIYLKKEQNLDQKLTAFLKPPTVILLENELPDHYF